MGLLTATGQLMKMGQTGSVCGYQGQQVAGTSFNSQPPFLLKLETCGRL